jgi:four helix bundle protein
VTSTDDGGRRGFRELRVWQEAVALAREAYGLADLLAGKHASLADQLRRSADSVHANIAEGSARPSRREYLRFLHVARGSFAETESRIEVARSSGLLPPGTTGPFETRARRVGVLLPALIRSLEPPGP